MENAPAFPKREQAPHPSVVNYTWSDVRAWEQQNKEYPHRALARLLLDRTNNTGRTVVSVDTLHMGEKDILVEDGIVASKISDNILTAKGLGSCVFLAGFKGGKGFLVHHIPGSVMHGSYIKLFERYGITHGDRDIQLVVGGGLKNGDMGSRQSGSGRKAPIAAAQEHELHIIDVGMRSDGDAVNYESTSVAIDPRTALIVVVSAEAHSEEVKDVSISEINQADVNRFSKVL